MKVRKRILVISTFVIIGSAAGAEAFGFKIPSFVRKHIPSPIRDVADTAFDKFATKKVKDVFKSLGIIKDPLKAGKDTEDNSDTDGIASTTSDVVNEQGQQKAIDGINNTVLSEDGQKAQSEQLEASDASAKAVDKIATSAKGVPVTQRKLDALLSQNREMARIIQANGITAQKNVQINAGISSGVNQINKRETAKELADTRDAEINANEMLNSGAYGANFGTGDYF